MDFTPWLINPGTITGTSYAGDYSNLGVTLFGAQTGSTGRIQEAINLVTTGGTVNVESGAYGEDDMIAKNLEIVGDDTGGGDPTANSFTLTNGAVFGAGSGGITAPEVYVNQVGAVGALIQDGILLASSGGTVNVAAGTYAQQVNVDKSVALLGAQAGNDANTRSAAFVDGSADPTLETIITASSVNPGGTSLTDIPCLGGSLISVTADNATINGFVLDGYNPNLPSQAGADQLNGTGPYIDVGDGISTYNGTGYVAVNTLTVEYNIVQNVDATGIAVVGPTDGSGVGSGAAVQNNVVQNFQFYGVQLAYNAYGSVSGNTVIAPDNADAGISVYNFTSTGLSGNTVAVTGNNVTIAQNGWGGIWANVFAPPAAAALNISDNTVNGADDVLDNPAAPATGPWPVVGIYLTSMDSNVTATLDGNAVTSYSLSEPLAAGIDVWARRGPAFPSATTLRHIPRSPTPPSASTWTTST